MKKFLAVAVIAGFFCAYGCQKAMTPTEKAPVAKPAAAATQPAVEKPAPAPAAVPAPTAPETKPVEEAK